MDPEAADPKAKTAFPDLSPWGAASGGMHKVRLCRSKLPLLRRQDSHMELLFYFGTLSTGSRM